METQSEPFIQEAIVNNTLEGIPFYGSISGSNAAFQYVINKSEPFSLEIAIPPWAPDQSEIKKSDLVHLHLMFKNENRFASKALFEASSQRSHDKDTYYLCSLLQETPKKTSLYFEWEGAFQLKIDHPNSILKLEDSVIELVLVKKGVLVYIKHLQNYFSRVIGFHDRSYMWLNLILFEDIKNRLLDHIEELQEMIKELKKNTPLKQISLLQNLAEFHQIISSEIDLDLINISFERNSHLPYLRAIKELEESLYWHYNNTMIILSYSGFNIKEHWLKKENPVESRV